MNKPDYLTDNDWNLLTEKYEDMEEVLEKLNNNYPVQYLIGNVNFYGYDILVNESVLIPRFETEGLIEKTIYYLKKYNLTDTKVLDIGTGSGCIPITLKKEIPSLDVTSIDISPDALRVAEENKKLNDVDITLKNISVFDYKTEDKCGLIISNPPYISEDEVIDPKTKYEPSISLYADDDGMYFYKYIISHAKNMLLDKSIIAFEIGCFQGDRLKEFAKQYFPNSIILIEKDLSERDRYLFIISE